jgi:DNA-directed RNA polymerase alpha subunit
LTEEFLTLVLDQLRAIRADLAEITPRLERIDGQLAAIAQTLALDKSGARRAPMTWDELPAITRSVLMKNGISTLAELAERSPVDLLKLPYFGKKSLKAVEKMLHEHGLTLLTKRNTYPGLVEKNATDN